MPTYTIETTYRLPAYRHQSYDAETPAQACRLAIEDEDWTGEKLDYETAGENYITGIWLGADAAYDGPSIPVPPQFEDGVQRRIAHFEVLLGVLKILTNDALAGRIASQDWLTKATWAVAKAEAFLADARGPDAPDDTGTSVRGREEPG